MSDPVLRLSGIEKCYNAGKPNEVKVLSGVDVTIAAGEVVALVAPSGAGKSTLLHIAGLLDVADRGTVEIAGEDMSVRSDRKRTAMRREAVGFVYQFHHLLPEFTALENITLPQLANGTPRREAELRAYDLMARVGVEGRAAHRPSTMSGGEQQRVAIARALANDPRLVIADEPTGNLDPATTERVFATLIKMVRDEGAAVLVATHNFALTQHMDRVLTLQDGKLVDYKPE